jgi:hypothetical protein
MPIITVYSINEAINCEMDYPKPFIIANERKNKNGKIAREYKILSSFKLFIKNREKFPNCHEILIRHKNFGIVDKEPGRLVFDFDIKNKYKIPKNFKADIELTIKEVCNEYYRINHNKLKFIWSSCKNDSKTSKHLTVKNIYFENWLLECPIFYKFFQKKWDLNYDWIESDKLIDLQIVKNRTSLRMVGSRKIGGHKLKFDDDSHILQDSLIRIYEDHNTPFIKLKTKYLNKLKPVEKIVIKNIKSSVATDATFSSNIYEKAFNIYNNKTPGLFVLGKINGNIATLMRIKSGKCYLSGNYHENENSYLLIKHDILSNSYLVRFGCYRKCGNIATKYVGSFIN